MLDLDEALERLHLCGPEYLFGLSNHGPMAIEALISIGHGALVGGYLDLYAPRLRPLDKGSALEPHEELSALGRIERFPDWLATVERELSEGPWQSVVTRRATGWLDGLFAGATHGLLRVAHAVRALHRAESEPRIRELAHGLAYWAARYQTLPGVPGEVTGEPLAPGRALVETPTLPQSQLRPGLFFQTALALESEPAFAETIRRIQVGSSLDPALRDLCRISAELYLRHPDRRVAYVHTLTAPSALRELAPLLDPVDRGRALGRATQAAAALHAISATAGSRALGDLPDDVLRLAESPDEIRYRAACSLDEHSIKLVDACLREHALAPSSVLLQAAADAASSLSSSNPAC